MFELDDILVFGSDLDIKKLHIIRQYKKSLVISEEREALHWGACKTAS